MMHPHSGRGKKLGAILITAALLTGLPALRAEEPTWPGTRLQEVLLRLNRVASLYRDIALNFSCHERISYDPAHSTPRVFDLEYIYYYDQEHGLMDYRTRAGGGRRTEKPAPEVVLKDLPVPTLVLRAYSVIFIFQQGRRDSYRYVIMRDEKVLGRDAIVIGFDAIPPYRQDDNDWFGEAWIDRTTYQPLKIQAWESAQHEAKRRLEAEIGSGPGAHRTRGHVIQNVTTEFFVEHNGMRFPSRVVTRKSLFRVKEEKGVRTAAEEPIFQVEQTYTDYRFYRVKTSEQIQELVSGPAPRPD